MQYKIPVQIENEDPILLWLSLKQLIIMLIWWSISYSIYDGLAPVSTSAVALIPAIFVFLIFLMVVLFKHSEMTFIPFVLNAIRLNLNNQPKIWVKSVDSFEPIKIWYTTWIIEKKENKINILEKKEKIKLAKDNLNKI